MICHIAGREMELFLFPLLSHLCFEYFVTHGASKWPLSIMKLMFSKVPMLMNALWHLVQASCFTSVCIVLALIALHTPNQALDAFVKHLLQKLTEICIKLHMPKPYSPPLYKLLCWRLQNNWSNKTFTKPFHFGN